MQSKQRSYKSFKGKKNKRDAFEGLYDRACFCRAEDFLSFLFNPVVLHPPQHILKYGHTFCVCRETYYNSIQSNDNNTVITLENGSIHFSPCHQREAIKQGYEAIENMVQAEFLTGGKKF